VNHGNVHWTGAAINFRQKRIESYDSMHDDRGRVYKVSTTLLQRCNKLTLDQLLRQYLDLEHRNKKKTPFDFTGWEDYTLAASFYCFVIERDTHIGR
jgi:sentrin-specific protease 1